MANEDSLDLPGEVTELSSDEVQTVRDEAKANTQRILESVVGQIKEVQRPIGDFRDWSRRVPDNYRIWFETHKKGWIKEEIAKAAGQEFDQMPPEIQAGVVYAVIAGEASHVDANVLGAGAPRLPQEIIEAYRKEWPQVQEHFIEDVLSGSGVSQARPEAIEVANFIGNNLYPNKSYRPPAGFAGGETGSNLLFYNGLKRGDFQSARVLENAAFNKVVAARPPSKA